MSGMTRKRRRTVASLFNALEGPEFGTDVTVRGNLQVDGETTLEGEVTANGPVFLEDNVEISGTELNYYGPGGGGGRVGIGCDEVDMEADLWLTGAISFYSDAVPVTLAAEIVLADGYAPGLGNNDDDLLLRARGGVNIEGDLDHQGISGHKILRVAQRTGTSTMSDDFLAVDRRYGVRVLNLASDPGTGEKGGIYFNTDDNKLKVYTGSAWETITSA